MGKGSNCSFIAMISSTLSLFLFSIMVEGLNITMNVTLNSDLFSSYRIGTYSDFRISYLNFDDDTLTLYKKSWENIRSLKITLILFEIILGLKVNFHKNMLVDVNIKDLWLVEASILLNCKIDLTSFLYHGLSIRGSPCWRLF